MLVFAAAGGAGTAAYFVLRDTGDESDDDGDAPTFERAWHAADAARPPPSEGPPGGSGGSAPGLPKTDSSADAPAPGGAERAAPEAPAPPPAPPAAEDGGKSGYKVTEEAAAAPGDRESTRNMHELMASIDALKVCA